MSANILPDQDDTFHKRRTLENVAHICSFARMAYVKNALFFYFFMNKRPLDRFIMVFTAATLLLLLFSANAIKTFYKNSKNDIK